MSEFSLLDYVPSKSNNTRQISSILFSNLYLLCSFIFLHPLYFSFMAFFSPCLFKLLSFLSPLFITTFLLLALLVASPNLLHGSNQYHEAVDKLGADADTDNDVFQDFEFEELEVYKTVFEASAFEARQNLQPEEKCEEEPVDKSVIQGGAGGSVSEVPTANLEANHAAEFGIEGFWEGNDGAGDLAQKRNKAQEQVKPESVESDKSVEQQSMRRSKSKRRGTIPNGGGECRTWTKVAENDRGFDSSHASSGPARKKKEWKRTLACKLFEERHNRGAEGMDMLWETHETESSKMQLRNTKGKEDSAQTYGDEDDDEEDDVGVKFCCLQALKFSAAKKMNTGMGRPNLVRFSRALKGIGWLHHASSKHGKKA